MHKDTISNTIIQENNENSETIRKIDDDRYVFDIVKRYHYSSCIYELYDEKHSYRHEHLNLDHYMHITSPIRRIIDLINMTEIIYFCNGRLNEKTIFDFLNSWRSPCSISQINASFKSIKYIHNETKILDMFYSDTKQHNDSFLSNEYIGYCMESIFEEKEDILRKVIFIPSLKVTTMLKLHKNDTRNDIISLYSKHKYKFYTFKDSYDEKQKIKIDIIL